MWEWIKERFADRGGTVTVVGTESTPPTTIHDSNPFLTRYDFLMKSNVLGENGIYPNLSNDRVKGNFELYSPDATGEEDWFEYSETWLGTYIRYGETFEERLGNQFRLWSPDSLAPIQGIIYDSNNIPIEYNFLLRNAEGMDVGIHHIDAANMVHIYNKKYAGMLRGKSFFQAAEALLKQLYEANFYQGEMLKTAALNPLFIYIGKDGLQQLSKEWTTGDVPTEEEVQAKFAGTIRTTPGSTQVSTVKIDPISLDRSKGFPTNGSEIWTKYTLLMIAAGLGLSKATITGDYTGNLAVAVRAIRDHDTRYYKRVQRKVNKAANNWFLAWVQSNNPNMQNTILNAFSGWSKPGFGALEPEKDAKALAILLAEKLESRTHALTAWGRDPEDLAKELENDKRLGLIKSTSEPEAEDDDEAEEDDDKDKDEEEEDEDDDDEDDD